MIEKDYRTIAILGVLSVVCSAVLVIFGVTKQLSSTDSESIIAKQRDELSVIKNASVNPTEKNLENIRSDIKRVNNDIARVNAMYGHTEVKAAEVFAKNIGMSMADLNDKWKTASDSAASDGGVYTLEKFENDIADDKRGISSDKFKKAYDRVKSLFDEMYLHELGSTPDESIEKVRGLIAYGFSGVAPKEQTEEAGNECQQLITNVTHKMRTYAAQCGGDEIALILPAEMSTVPGQPTPEYYFMFDEFRTTPPTKDDVPSILRQLNAVECMVKLMKQARVAKIEEMKRHDGAWTLTAGSDNLIRYRYTIKVQATQAALRQFVNSLYDAAEKYNHFYTIRNFDIVKANYVDEEQKLLPTINIAGEESENFLMQRYDNERNSGTKKGVKTGDESTQPLVGTHQLLNATLEIEYLYYVDDAKGDEQ